MSKVLWCDTETTGLQHWKHGIIQLAGMIEVGGKVLEEFNYYMKPKEGVAIEDAALKVSGITREAIEHFSPQEEAFGLFKTLLEKHANPYNKADKFVMAGYNIGFDADFIRSWFYSNGDKFFGSWFWGAKLDVLSFVADAEARRTFHLLNHKLETVCKKFDIEFSAHNALDDIIATRKLYQLLRKGIVNGTS